LAIVWSDQVIWSASLSPVSLRRSKLANAMFPREQTGASWPQTNERLVKTARLYFLLNSGTGSPPPSEPFSGSSPSIQVSPPSCERKKPDGTCTITVLPTNWSW
jgi:hypothetical protein